MFISLGEARFVMKAFATAAAPSGAIHARASESEASRERSS